jgi:hypothetical protein
VFLAGDSAHAMPPNGGFGGNTGMQDAQNLAWKLAMVLRGAAGPALLSTYHEERRPIGVFTTEQAYSRYVTRTAPYLGTEGMQPVAPDLDVELGYGYRSRAVQDEGDPAPLHMSPRETGGRPGTRAPHCWIEEGRRSTLDLFGRGFVLIAGSGGAGWVDAARRAVIDVDTHRLGEGDLADADGRIATAYGLVPQGAMLIRPDGFVAWRTAQPAGVDAAQRFATVCGRILCQPAPTSS